MGEGLPATELPEDPVLGALMPTHLLPFPEASGDCGLCSSSQLLVQLIFPHMPLCLDSGHQSLSTLGLYAMQSVLDSLWVKANLTKGLGQSISPGVYWK